MAENSRRDFKLDNEAGIYKNKDAIAQLIPYEYEGFHYALDMEAEPILRAYMASAITAYHCQISNNNDISFKEILQSVQLSNFSDENSVSQIEYVRQVIVEEAYTASRIIEKYYEWNIKRKNKSQAFILFTVSMNRLYTSFKASVTLLNYGFFVECSAVFRMILEQLGWACYLLEEKDETKILSNNITKDISYIKTVLETNFYAKLYGSLSKEAHLDPKSIYKYLKIHVDDGNQGLPEECLNNDKEISNILEISVRDRSGEECEKDTRILVELLKAYGDIVWAGMSRYGFLADDDRYFKDWYDVHKLMIQVLIDAIKGKIELKRE